jgi:DNA-binding LacI/PurR family transcriptional regulator
VEKDSAKEAFNKYMKGNGLPYEGCVWNTHLPEKEERVAYIIENHRKRAYYCVSYYVAIQAIGYCRKNGLSVPHDVAFITFDYFSFFEYIHPRLAGIKQPFEAMGAKAVENLVKLIQGGKTTGSEYFDPIVMPGDTA